MDAEKEVTWMENDIVQMYPSIVRGKINISSFYMNLYDFSQIYMVIMIILEGKTSICL